MIIRSLFQLFGHCSSYSVTVPVFGRCSSYSVAVPVIRSLFQLFGRCSSYSVTIPVIQFISFSSFICWHNLFKCLFLFWFQVSEISDSSYVAITEAHSPIKARVMDSRCDIDRYLRWPSDDLSPLKKGDHDRKTCPGYPQKAAISHIE
jgi:hypothetical protein